MMVTDLFVLIGVLLLWIILSVFNDYYVISYWGEKDKEKSQKWWHILDATKRVVFSTYIFYLVLGLKLATFSFVILYLAIFWIMFDEGLNYLRKRPFLYVGFNSYIDRVIRTSEMKINLFLNNKLKPKNEIKISYQFINLFYKLLVLGISIKLCFI